MLGIPPRIRPRVYASPADVVYRPLGERRRAIETRDVERRAYEEDPLVRAVRRVRAALAAQGRDHAEAQRQWHAANDATAGPAAIGGAMMHPERAAALASFVAAQGWNDDPAAPIRPMPTVEDIAADVCAATNRELAEALAHCARIEAERRGETVTVPDAVAQEPAKRGHGRSPHVEIDDDAIVMPDLDL